MQISELDLSNNLLPFKKFTKSNSVTEILCQRLLSNSSAKAFREESFLLNPSQTLDHELNQITLGSGKRFRAILAFVMGDLFNESLETSRIIARAAEQVHAAFLCHDDVIDEADERRARPTFNKATHNRRAILAGDTLLATVMMDVASLNNTELIGSLSKCIRDTVSGEIDQDYGRWRDDLGWLEIESIAARKTGALFGWTASAHARMKQAPAPIIIALERIGARMGILFQMADDRLDFHARGEKQFAKDLREGLTNSATLALLEQNPDLKMGLIANFQQRQFFRFWTEEQWKNAQAVHDSRINIHRQSMFQDLDFLEIQLSQINQKNGVSADTRKLREIIELVTHREI